MLTAGVLAFIAAASPDARGSQQRYSSVSSSIFSTSEMEIDEAWKREPYRHQAELGALTGLGVFDGNVGYSLLVNGAISLSEEGFIDEISDQIFLEGFLGPLFLKQGTALDYGVHARWDFNKDRHWSFFATGGIAGTITGEALGDAWRLYPRFAVGVLRSITTNVRLRAELSHDLIVMGASYRF